MNKASESELGQDDEFIDLGEASLQTEGVMIPNQLESTSSASFREND